MGKQKHTIIGYKSLLQKRRLQKRALRQRISEQALCEAASREKDIKGVVDYLLREVEKNFPSVSQNLNTVQKIFNKLSDSTHSSNTTTSGVVSSVSKNTQLISNDSSSLPVLSKVSKNSIKVKPNAFWSTAIEHMPTRARASKAIAKEKIYQTVNFPRYVSEFNTIPQVKLLTKKSHPSQKKPPTKESSPIPKKPQTKGNTQTEENTLTSKPFLIKKKIITGRRIINFTHFLNEIKNVNNHSESGHCNLNNIIFTGEKQNGLRSAYYVMCTVCGYQNIIWSENPYQRNNNVSYKFITGMLNLKHTLKVINKFLAKVQLPLFDQAVYLHECRKLLARGKKQQFKFLNLSNTATSQSETALDKNFDMEHKAHSMQEYISSVPCKNTEDFEKVLIEDQFEIKQEENDSEFEDESEVILTHQTVLNKNKDKLDVDETYETVIKQEIDSDTDAVDSITSKMVTVENVSNTDYAHSSKEISQQIKSGTLNNTMIPDSNIESIVKLNNEHEAELPFRKAKTLMQGSRMAVNQNYINLNQNKAVNKFNSVEDVANFSKPKLDSSETAMNKGNLSFGVNSRKLMTDQQTSSAVHINSGNNVCNAEPINFANSQITPTTFTNQSVSVVPMQCLPQPNNFVTGPPIQHNSAVQTYWGLNTAPIIPPTSAVHQPQTGEPNANQPLLQQLANYCASRNKSWFIHPD